MATSYQPQDFSSLLGLAGFSDTMLTNHFTLYQGYVKNTNLLTEKLVTLEAGTPEHSEIQRRLGWEWDGMKMHEWYFGNMSQETSAFPADSELGKKITNTWGSYEAWQKSFAALGAMRGIGWAVLAQSNDTQELFLTWIGDHHVGHPINASYLLVMDCWEHAYMTDYGIKRADYIEAFLKVVDWKKVEARYEAVQKGEIIQS